MIPLLVFITLPSATSLLAELGTYADPLFQELHPILIPILGILVVAFLLAAVFKLFHH